MTRQMILFIGPLTIVGCTTMSVPDVDFDRIAGFENEAENIQSDYPSPDETPPIPTDVRSDENWDDAARQMQQLQGNFDVPDIEPGLSPEEFDREFNALQERAKAYKDDDPQ